MEGDAVDGIEEGDAEEGVAEGGLLEGDRVGIRDGTGVGLGVGN